MQLLAPKPAKRSIALWAAYDGDTILKRNPGEATIGHQLLCLRCPTAIWLGGAPGEQRVTIVQFWLCALSGRNLAWQKLLSTQPGRARGTLFLERHSAKACLGWQRFQDPIQVVDMLKARQKKNLTLAHCSSLFGGGTHARPTCPWCPPRRKLS